MVDTARQKFRLIPILWWRIGLVAPCYWPADGNGPFFVHGARLLAGYVFSQRIKLIPKVIDEYLFEIVTLAFFVHFALDEFVIFGTFRWGLCAARVSPAFAPRRTRCGRDPGWVAGGNSAEFFAMFLRSFRPECSQGVTRPSLSCPPVPACKQETLPNFLQDVFGSALGLRPQGYAAPSCSTIAPLSPS